MHSSFAERKRSTKDTEKYLQKQQKFQLKSQETLSNILPDT